MNKSPGMNCVWYGCIFVLPEIRYPLLKKILEKLSIIELKIEKR